MLSAVLGVTSILFVGDSLVASQYFWLREALVEQGYRCAESAARHHAEGSVKHSLCSGTEPESIELALLANIPSIPGLRHNHDSRPFKCARFAAESERALGNGTRARAVVFNVGAWYEWWQNHTSAEALARFEVDVRKLGTCLARLARPGDRVVWREVAPSHFSSPDGSFGALLAAIFDGTAARDAPCRPLAPGVEPWQVAYNRAADLVLPARVERLRVYDATAPLWDDHKATTATASGIRDCTHFADGGDAQALWTRLLLALLARET